MTGEGCEVIQSMDSYGTKAPRNDENETRHLAPSRHPVLDTGSINVNALYNDNVYKTHNIGYNSDMKHHYYFCKNFMNSSRFTHHSSQKSAPILTPSHKRYSIVCSAESHRGRKYAFTLAEVLITLGIIGVVAALTIPSLIAKHQKQVTVNKLKKAYSTLSQMVVSSYADNGPATDFLTSNETVDANKTKKFFETYWLPYFNGPVVANQNKSFYSEMAPFTSLNEQNVQISIVTSYDLGRILFSTQDSTIYNIWVMSWGKDDNNQDIQLYSTNQKVYVDINGTKLPNKYGKDVFMFNIDFSSNIVRPECYNFSITSINNNCKKNAYGNCCAAKIIKDGWEIKDDYPW